MSTCPVCAPGRLDPKRQRPDHRPAQQGSESRTPNRGRRTRTGAWRVGRGRRLDEHGDLHAIPAVAAAADEVEAARVVEPEDEVVAAAVAEDGAAAVARRVRRLVHLRHVEHAPLVLELCKQTRFIPPLNSFLPKARSRSHAGRLDG